MGKLSLRLNILFVTFLHIQNNIIMLYFPSLIVRTWGSDLPRGVSLIRASFISMITLSTAFFTKCYGPTTVPVEIHSSPNG